MEFSPLFDNLNHLPDGAFLASLLFNGGSIAVGDAAPHGTDLSGIQAVLDEDDVLLQEPRRDIKSARLILEVIANELVLLELEIIDFELISHEVFNLF